MKLLLHNLIVGFFVGMFALNGSTAAADDFQKAVKAYDVGNFSAAIKLLLPLAKAGDVKAQLQLGLTHDFADGRTGVNSDNTKAQFWYEKAVKQDYTPAFRSLGIHLVREFKDAKRGYSLLKVAARRGDAKAQLALGVYVSSSNWGITEDRAAARKWFLKALEQKYSIAAFYLLKMDRREGDLVEAHKWDLIDQFLEKRNKTNLLPDVREDMTESQIAESQRRAKAWLLAHGEKP